MFLEVILCMGLSVGGERTIKWSMKKRGPPEALP